MVKKKKTHLNQPEEVIGVISGCVEVLSSSFIVGQLHGGEKQVRDHCNLWRGDTFKDSGLISATESNFIVMVM